MRIRVPPQLIVFALGLAVAAAIPGLPRRHYEPPSIAAGLAFDALRSVDAAWTGRLESLYPSGTSVRTLMHELRRQDFEVSQYQERLSGGLLTYGFYQWPYGRECFWILGVVALSDSAGTVEALRGQARYVCDYPL